MANSPTRSGDESGAAINVESAETFEDLLATDETVLIDFYADWCGPCQMIADTVEELAAESDATVVKVDVDVLPQVAAQYEVRSIPAFVVVEDGTRTEQFVGMHKKADLRAAIE